VPPIQIFRGPSTARTDREPGSCGANGIAGTPPQM